MIYNRKSYVETKYFKRTARWVAIILILSVCLLFSMVLASIVGPMPVSVGDALGIIVHRIPILGNVVNGQWTALEESVVVQLRLPRVLSAVLVGVALSIAGVVFQGIFRNPMADPYVLGVASGAGFGALLAIVFGVGLPSLGLFYAIPLMACMGALSTIFLVYAIARTDFGIPVLRLLLAGIAVNSFFSSMISLVIATAGEDVHFAFDWLFGGFPISRWEYINVISPAIFVCSVMIYAFARDLNVMLLGEEQAQQLGVEVENVKKRLITLGSLITAFAVSISGIIGFLGLIVPHMMRISVGPDHRILIPSSALAGASLLVLCDAVARTILRPIVLPTGILTALLGTPFFVYLLMKSGKIMV
jgi:iron complex transport system permease protein